MAKTKSEEVEMAAKAEMRKGPTAPDPVTNRVCRDVFWLILFILYWVGMFVLAGFAYNRGDPMRLIYGTDMNGDLCGTTNKGGRDNTNLPYLYYLNPIAYNDSGVCIAKCPEETTTFLSDFDVKLNKSICAYDYTPANGTQLEAFVLSGQCVVYAFESTDFFMRCIPDLVNTNATANMTLAADYIKQEIVNVLNSYGISMQLGRDIYNEWRIILAGFFVAVGCALIWLLALQALTGVVVWFTILAIVATSIAATAYFWYNYYNLYNGYDFFGRQFTLAGLDTYVYNTTTFLVCAIILSVITLLLLFTLIFLFKRIRLAVAIIKVASRAVLKMPSLLFYPLVKSIFLGLLGGFFVFILVYLSTAGEITEVTFQMGSSPAYTFQSNYLYNYLQIYALMGFFWGWNMIIAIGDTAVAGSVAQWYWTLDKKSLPWFIIARSTWRVFRYHLGSLALGSMILALVQVIRYLLYRLERQTAKSGNAVANICVKCMQCIMWCFERFIKFLNKNAYIQIAVYGYSFCKAARKAFSLIVRNVIRIAVVTKVGDFVLFIACLSITALSGIAGNYMIINYATNPTFWIYPVMIIMILAYGVAYCFMCVMGMAISTIFICFCEDIERNDGSAERPYFMVKKLLPFVDKDKEQSDLAAK